MSRIPPRPPREAIADAEREAYDRVVERQAAVWPEREDPAGPFYGPLLHSPPLALSLSEQARWFVTGEERGSYTNADREWVDLVLANEVGWNAVLPAHLADAVAVGIPPAEIRALREGREDGLSPDRSALAEYIRRVLHGEVTDAWFARMTERFGLRGAIEYTALICRLALTERLYSAFGIQGPPDEAIDAILAGYEDGTVVVGEPHVG
jgi:hypothetical protein